MTKYYQIVLQDGQLILLAQADNGAMVYTELGQAYLPITTFLIRTSETNRAAAQLITKDYYDELMEHYND